MIKVMKIKGVGNTTLTYALPPQITQSLSSSSSSFPSTSHSICPLSLCPSSFVFPPPAPHPMFAVLFIPLAVLLFTFSLLFFFFVTSITHSLTLFVCLPTPPPHHRPRLTPSSARARRQQSWPGSWRSRPKGSCAPETCRPPCGPWPSWWSCWTSSSGTSPPGARTAPPAASPRYGPRGNK